MIQRLTESFISGVELVESECRLARHHAVGLVAGALALSGLAAIALIGLLAMLTGATLWLATLIGVAPALLSVGGVAAAGAGFGAMTLVRRLRAKAVNA